MHKGKTLNKLIRHFNRNYEIIKKRKKNELSQKIYLKL